MADIEIRNLIIEYRSGPYVVRPIDELDLDLASGELVVILGASGCGKTSLLSVLAGILTPTRGEVVVAGHPVASMTDADLVQYRRSTVGVVFQSFNLVPSLTAVENVSVPLWSAGVKGRRARDRASELLCDLGLGERLRHRSSELSGGQQQRVAIARALVHDPPVLLADEPTAHLDSASVQEVLRVLRDLARPGRIVVITTHDPRLLAVADRVVELGVPAGGLVDEATERRLAPGEILFCEGDQGSLVYRVEEGSIELVRLMADGDEELMATVGEGGYFGELAPLLQLPRSATARAQKSGARVAGMTPTEFRAVTGAGIQSV